VFRPQEPSFLKFHSSHLNTVSVDWRGVHRGCASFHECHSKFPGQVLIFIRKNTAVCRSGIQSGPIKPVNCIINGFRQRAKGPDRVLWSRVRGVFQNPHRVRQLSTSGDRPFSLKVSPTLSLGPPRGYNSLIYRQGLTKSFQLGITARSSPVHSCRPLFDAMTSSLPPSTIDPRIERLLVLARQPMSIATIASIGVHGVLLFMAPSLPQGQQAKAEGPKTVNVVQLTPEEQQRLPNFSKSIPALSNPLVAGNPSLYSSPSGLPNPSSLPPLPPVGNPGSLPPLPDPTQLWGQVKPPTSFSIPAPPSGTSFPSIPNTPQQIPPPIPAQKAPPKTLPSVNPGEPTESEQPPESSPSPSPSLPSAAEVQRQRDEAAQREAAPSQPPGPAGYTRSIEGTSSQEQGQNLIALITPFATAGQKYELKPVEETLIFPDAICPKDAGKAVVSVVVNTIDGAIQSTQMIQKAGYGALDKFSEAQAKAKTFAPNSKAAAEYPITIYNYTFTFVEPEGGCKAAPAATSSPEPTTSPASPGATPSPTASPSPQ
jgi:hypothetical protein